MDDFYSWWKMINYDNDDDDDDDDNDDDSSSSRCWYMIW